MTIKDIDIEELKKMDFTYKYAEDVEFAQDTKRRRLFKALPYYQDAHLEIARNCRVKADAKYLDKPEARRKYFKLLMTEALKHFQTVKEQEPIRSITEEQAQIYWDNAHYFPQYDTNKKLSKLERSRRLFEKQEGIKLNKMLDIRHPLTGRLRIFERELD